MVSLSVVVLDVLMDDEAEVTLPEENHPVETLLFDGTDKSLGIGVQVRASRRELDRLDTAASEDLAKRASEERVAIVDQVGRSAQKPVGFFDWR